MVYIYFAKNLFFYIFVFFLNSVNANHIYIYIYAYIVNIVYRFTFRSINKAHSKGVR